jgi:uncharacterized C2H2 Zn-finger protein
MDAVIASIPSLSRVNSLPMTVRPGSYMTLIRKSRVRGNRKVEIRVCAECKLDYEWLVHDGRKPTYCSKCKFVVAARKQRASTYKYQRTCVQCLTSYMARRPTGRYCSDKCEQAYRYRNGQIDLSCANCGAIFKRQAADVKHKKIYCGRECMWADKIKKAPRSNKLAAVRKWFGRFNRMSKCEKCGYSEIPGILIIHHKDRDRNNNPLSNLAVLCPNCHAIEHLAENKKNWNGHLSTDPRKVAAREAVAKRRALGEE